MFNDGDDDDGNSDERKRIFLCLFIYIVHECVFQWKNGRGTYKHVMRVYFSTISFKK